MNRCFPLWIIGAVLLLSAGLPERAAARMVTLTVLATTDMHGSIRATPGRYLEHNDGSLLQIATLVRRIRAETPNVLLVDCGDIFQGTAESLLSGGEVMARAMNDLDYTAFAVGNHEFDWGVPEAGRLLSLLQATPLAANLLRGPEAPAAFQRIQPYVLREVDGLRVAILGLTNPNLNHWFRDMAPLGLRACDSRSAIERVLPELRRLRPQIQILLVHQGLQSKDDDANEINAIARRFSEFDLILGGHLHWTLAGGRIGQADYAQAGSGARGLLRVDLDYDTLTGAITGKRFAFIPVTPDLPEDPEILADIAPLLARADREMNHTIGRTETDLTASTAIPGDSPVQQLFGRAISEATGASVVLHGILSDAKILRGPVRIADVWRLVPYENGIGCAQLTIAEIRAILEENTAFLGTARAFSAWGLRYDLHPNAPPGSRIQNLRWPDGSPIHGRQRIRTAFNSYHLSSGGGRFPVLTSLTSRPRAQLQMEEKGMREIVIDYIQAHPILNIPAGTDITVIRQERPKGLHRLRP